MSDQRPAAQRSAWNELWQDSQSQPLAPHERQLADFWAQALTGEIHARTSPRLLDIACGNGAVVRSLDEQSRSKTSIVCVDYSTEALQRVRQFDARIDGMVADAATLPLPAGSCDIVTSQFGIEYAGTAAVVEAARVTAPGGVLMGIFHLAGGALHTECTQHLEAAKLFGESGFLDSAKAVFDAGFAVLEGRGSVVRFERRERRFAPTVVAARHVLARFGEGAAAGAIAAAIAGVEKMYRDIAKYSRGEVLTWIGSNEVQLQSYARRMQAMSDAAVDDARWRQWLALLTGAGLQIDVDDCLTVTGERKPFARRLVCRR